NIILNHEFHFGGYAKTNFTLEDFRTEFMKKYQLKIDKIYNAKLFYGVSKLIEEGFFAPGSRIVCVNTGGNYE
ncbi:MAG: 1-aminocyclopropane-1-carboxylate deaminase/D-cysteine desulfhydrase, partial [Bacteroidota bacterium]